MGKNNYQIYAKVALELAKDAGDLLIENFHEERTINYKGRIDLVTEMDMKCEKLIVGRIRDEFPDHGILAEEGSSINTDAELIWYIDPLDGTTNYAHGFGFFAVSIALWSRSDNSFLTGVVNAPYLNELYSAVLGTGAELNGKKITVSDTEELSKSLVATGFPYDVNEEVNNNLDNFEGFLKTAQAVRRPGSAAIDMCAVAAGKFDGFWELRLHPWDTAAGLLIVKEAGGIVTDFNGMPFNPHMSEVLATNGLIHEEMKDILNKNDKK